MYKLFDIVFYTVFAAIFIVVGYKIANVFGEDEVSQIGQAVSYYTGEEFSENINVWVDNPNKVHDNLLLLSTYTKENTPFVLVDNQGEVLHKWKFDFDSELDLEEFKNDTIFLTGSEKPDVKMLFWGVDSHLYEDGSLIGIAAITTKFNLGMFNYSKLVMLNKESKVLWSKYGKFHHEIEVFDDEIIVISTELIEDVKPLNFVSDKNKQKIVFMDNYVNKFSKNGKLLEKTSVYEAFMNSDFYNYLNVTEKAVSFFSLGDERIVFDPFHLNSTLTITENNNFLPFTKVGDVFLSFRDMSLIALLRPSENKIVWARRGPWENQHDLKITNDGSLTMFDNDGGFIIFDDYEDNEQIASKKRSRVVKYNPLTEKSEVLFQDNYDRIISSESRSIFHQLSDKTSIIKVSYPGTLLQIDENGEIIWELRSRSDRYDYSDSYYSIINGIQVYNKVDINF